MKIKSIEKHDITLAEFKKLSKSNPCFGAWRQVSKTINFATLFGAGASTLAMQLEDSGFKESECDEYIKLIGLETELTNTIIAMKNMERKKVKYLVCAKSMLDTYYKTYTGVQKRSVREVSFARKNGYVRTWHGPVKHLPILKYVKFDSRGNALGADKELYSKMISHAQNEGGNGPIQSLEARVSFGTQIAFNDYCREWGLKSRQWNTVHDSMDIYVYKPELELVLALMQACASWIRQPYYNVQMCMDFTICDPGKGREHAYYKGGTEEIQSIPIEEAVEHWNSSHPDHQIKWHGCRI